MNCQFYQRKSYAASPLTEPPKLELIPSLVPNSNLNRGVPQGSILSPTLFTFYTHDLPLPQSDLSTDVIFADDVTQVVEYRGNDREQLAVQTEGK